MPGSPRRDAYGRPLPELADVQHASTYEQPSNIMQRQLLHALVEDTCRATARRNWTGIVVLRFNVVDGSLQRDMYTSLERVWRPTDMEQPHDSR